MLLNKTVFHLVVAIKLGMVYPVWAEISVLEQLQWQNRALVVCALQEGNLVRLAGQFNQQELAKRQLRIFASSYFGVFELNKDNMKSSDFKFQLCDEMPESTAHLIGLDGTIKASYLFESLNEKAIYRDIDAMPMRQLELNRLKVK
ncbi:DUF4174 domain-containing protein [Pseudoalteromonas luteoviolacea]|uniref:DUF4174 domain-containing protein n=1 Tax=Pseudoalteromonas luteoviolacea S4054 TaxID=1129367 RepID=A0A0F6A7A4_9GAMM|nr:DUF4174 domain-containing protein [Pseudoalteromonas luteoviolacea]AOT08908.1 hypothetical protein S4054249_14030 [Pseudoalteromonas luteoviolacea]AOT13820.1 hypothetical protein S40542_14000 [Pseudoalteromonas luteoviolacea]AOT18735.1 hypothetical protein S4054_14005 [Pseudoalteromonas luteoviolacea]KKE81731.1 hypothetical protein N479_21110 [Pseudoalteromonas luteoviolacea S4054]KZN68035.1 hypothetical protein N481_23630 [Pseudoalteromonas luteoviolacea S4047-1]